MACSNAISSLHLFADRHIRPSLSGVCSDGQTKQPRTLNRKRGRCFQSAGEAKFGSNAASTSTPCKHRHTLCRLATLLEIMVSGRSVIVDHSVPQPDSSCSLQDVLRDILSRLSLKQVVRMSILSHEWRRLRICHPDLVFTKDTFGINTAMNTEQASMTVGELLKFGAKKLELLTRKFIDNVLRPLWSTSTTTTTTTTLDKFVVKFDLRRKHKYYIDRWVTFSTASRAKHITLDFRSDGTLVSSGFDEYMYAFPLSNLSGPNGSFVRSLYLGTVYLELPPSFCGITNLKELTLNTVSINGDDLQCLMLSCALLENLNLESCSSLSSLRIGQELSRLQYLRVRYCDMEILELHAPNLCKFEFDDYLKQTVLSDSSKLSEAIFVSNLRLIICNGDGYDDILDDIFSELPTSLAHVQTLLLLLNAIQVEKFTITRNSFISLRHLNMNLDIYLNSYDDSWVMGFINLLGLAPLLEELEVHMEHDRYCSPNQETVTAAEGPLHHHLRSVYMSGFCDVSGLAELSLYILGNATVLERMVIDPVAGMKDDLNTECFYSVSKGGSSEKFVLPTEGVRYCVDERRMFARNNLDRDEFRHILTIL